jgi:hypothetical protein
MKILIFTGYSGWAIRTHNVAILLKRKFPNLEINCVVFGKANYEFLVQQKDIEYNKILLAENFWNHSLKVNVSEKVLYYENKFNIPLTQIAYQERTMAQNTHSIRYKTKFDHSQICSMLIKCIEEIEELVNNSEFVFTYTSASHISQLVYYLSKSEDITYLTINHNRISDNYRLNDNPYDNPTEIVDAYNNNQLKITKKGEEIFNLWCNRLVSNKKIESWDGYLSNKFNSKKINYKNLSTFIQKFFHPDTSPVAKSNYQRIIDAIKYYFRIHFVNKNLSTVLPNCDYIYFPLSTVPEASLLIRGFRYYSQIHTIEQISANIPLNYKLVVKEHPGMVGINSISFYKKLASIFNVIVVHPGFSNADLISNTISVITITGSVGLEAMGMGAKVITLGDSIYSFLNSCNKVNEINRINTVINKPHSEKDKSNQIRDLKFLASALNKHPIEDPDKILWTKKAFNPEMNQVDINIYNALMRKLSW